MPNAFVRGLIAACLALCASLPLAADPKPLRKDLGATPPDSLMWVGNSFFYYNNSMHNEYGRLARSVEDKFRPRSVSVTISGAGIDWHDVAAYLQPSLIGKYSFVGDNEIRFNKAGRQFDAVILMDCSQCPVHPQLQPVFHDTVKKHAETITKYGARPVLFMSWAYKDKPEMIKGLADEYTKAGNANDALVIPAGLAFDRAVRLRPSVELYVPDKRHPSVAGTYLAAATTYAALRGKSPVGASYVGTLDPALARFLQEVAWDTVQAYFGRP
jgi:hypothetical protein